MHRYFSMYLNNIGGTHMTHLYGVWHKDRGLAIRNQGPFGFYVHMCGYVYESVCVYIYVHVFIHTQYIHIIIFVNGRSQTNSGWTSVSGVTLSHMEKCSSASYSSKGRVISGVQNIGHAIFGARRFWTWSKKHILGQRAAKTTHQKTSEKDSVVESASVGQSQFHGHSGSTYSV